MNQNTKVILVGGFLGAGKTTLLLKAAQELANRKKRVGLITNDQAPELVDSTLLEDNGMRVAEVSGSCFCCNFNGFTDAIRQIRADVAADVIIAEPVGSCTDLSATIMQPLKQHWSDKIGIAPLSVLADPERLAAILDGGQAGLHEDAAYIYRKQLEESDVIVINKTDLLSAEKLDRLVSKTKQAYPNSTVMTVSALTGEGIEAWLDEVIRRNDAGKRLVEVDYDIYANGEAVLGWLNGTVRLSGKATDWDAFTRALLADLSACFDAEHLPVGHVKVIIENGPKFMAGNLTGGRETLSVRGSAGSGEEAKLIVNARVETSPEHLDQIVRRTLDARCAGGGLRAEAIAWRYLQPGRPQPTHRFTEVVQP